LDEETSLTIVASMLWRRVDVPGHDACHLEQTDAGWHLEGAAVFRHPEGPANVAYSVHCDEGWRTTTGRVWGALGRRSVDYRLTRQAKGWTLNDRRIAGLDHLLDLDLSFTPATNLQQLQRVPIGEGETVHLPVAWLDIDAGALSELPQIYRRRGETALWYEAPSVGYTGPLRLAPNGFIQDYPNLWEAEPPL
jgi:uncharacterized protein